ncbi:GNAT family N-acetyltransferase [Bosea sp. (in: a-proteobacteria)]|uniref:bifunctional acetate--CoA ligase family protein/GNAT family N-acetyltransferase n=1 Tax=Bosea sp. (in: a-proteobacteria) TaxID=1871050 RepID=UPI001AC1A2CE|nr:GNAT family N-acetyltransferase [Bosea sp. (in: a-proteobacteria)]MBN9443577.1 GNAT family N-acetyltransferase [Bosea sp. (in: a-proteobacteria)]
MTLALLRRMLEPARVAVVTGCPETDVLAEQIKAGSYRGEFVLLADGAALSSTSPVDLLIAPIARAGDVMAVAVAAGRGHAGLLVPDGGAADGERLRIAARAAGLRLIGPSSLGLAAPRLGLNATAVPVQLRAGSLALIAQSNSVAAGILAWAARRGIGLSGAVILGDGADVDIADSLDHFGADLSTRTILLAIDDVSDAARFLSSARAAARLKPVLVLKPPRREAPWPALTHSALIVTSDAAHDAAFHRAGLLRVDDLDELFAAAETLGRARATDAGRLAIVSNGEGLAALAAARLRRVGGIGQALREPEIVRTARDYAGAITRLLAEDDVDAVLALNAPVAPADSADCARAAAEARSAAGGGKPVLAVWVGAGDEIGAVFASAGIPSFATEQEAVIGFQHLTRHARLLKELMATPAALDDEGGRPDIAAATELVDRALAEGRSWLEPDEVARLLSLFGIPALDLVIAADADAAALAARGQFEAGRTVALKIVSPDVAHKSDVGGVELDLAKENAVREGALRMAERLRKLRPEARLTGFMVQPMAHRTRARELIAGFSVDPCFGPVIVFGRGGTAAELIADTHVALPPLDLASAENLIAATRVSRILGAYRDVPAADRRAIAAVLVALGTIASELPQIRAMDLNPVLADADGVVAVDARVVLEPDPARRRRPAIRPYPAAWTSELVLGERRFLIRPMRPEDEFLVGAMLARVTPEDLRLRFFAPLKSFSHTFLARLTQLDYAREMAFIAIDEEGAAAGAVRLHADPAHVEAEYAILLRSDLKGLGLGRALMELIIDWAGAEKVHRVHSQVLAENGPMLALCRTLGFEITLDPDDISVRHVALSLDASGGSGNRPD